MKNINITCVFDFFSNLLSPDPTQAIYNLLGILGFVFSGFLWIYTLYRNRTNLDIEIKDYSKAFGHVVQLYLYLQNNSDNPLTISGLSLIHKEKKYLCELLPKKIRKTGDSLIQTPMFPVNLSPQQGVFLPFEFLNCQDIEIVPDKKIVLEIHTNRKKLKKSLTLDQPGTLLHL